MIPYELSMQGGVHAGSPEESMKMMPLRLLLLAALAASTVFASTSFQGTFVTDDQAELFQFTIGSPQLVTIESWGYGGGTNAALTVIPPGGFDSLFTLYDGTGSQIGSFNDCAGLGTGQISGFQDGCLDAYFSSNLSAGTYYLALTQSGNYPNGNLSDGFSQQGAGNFTCAPFSISGAFCDSFGSQDNGNWAVDFFNVDSVSDITNSVPESASFLLTGCGVALFALSRRRKAPDVGRDSFLRMGKVDHDV